MHHLGEPEVQEMEKKNKWQEGEEHDEGYTHYLV